VAKNDPQAHKKSNQQDDFKLIAGISQGIENRLHKAGIRTYAQIASLTPQKILLKLGNIKGYSAKRIEDENWIGQASKRCKQGVRQKTLQKTTPKTEIRQHYENFTIEFLLDDRNVCRRTRVRHVQSGDADTWAGWEPEQLANFLARHAGLGLPGRRETVSAVPAPDQGTTIPTEPPPFAKTEATELLPAQENINSSLVYKPISTNIDSVGQSPSMRSRPKPSLSEETKKGLEKIHLREWKIFARDTNVPSHILNHDQIFDLSLMLVLDREMFPFTSDVKYCATIYAKQIGTKNRQSIGEVQNISLVSNKLDLMVNCASLSPGIYRLEALVTLEPAGNQPERLAVKELLECGLLQVY
jgi:hypothetical protein